MATEKRTMYLTETNQGHILNVICSLNVGDKIVVGPPGRSLGSNALMWSRLTDVSEQVMWHGQKLDKESWKHLFTSTLKKMVVVPNLEGNGFVAMGLSTSKMSKAEMSDLIELITAFGAERDVKWSK